MKKFLSKILIIYLSFVFLLFFSVNLYAQNPQWIIYNTTNSGLPSNYTTDIVIDSNNVKWIGTDSGLVRFYNQQWMVYDKSNSPLTTNIIYKLEIDKHNNLWIGTIENGLYKFDGINWTKYDTINSLGIALKSVLGLKADSLNNLWICNYYGLLKFSNNNNWTKFDTTNSGLPTHFFISIDIENHIKWLGTGFHGLVKFNDTNWVIYNSTNSGLPNNFVHCIFVDNFKNKWIGTYFGGAAKFDSQNNSWVLYNTYWPGLPSNDIRTIFIENNQIKWFGTSGSGAAKYNDTMVVTFGNPLTSTLIRKITTDKYNNIWIATGNELAVYNPYGVIGINPNTAFNSEYKLFQNYPNPFNPATTIKYSIPKNEFVNMKIYDVTGREIMILVNEIKQAGYYSVSFDGSNLSSGVYFYRILAGDFTAVKRMLMIK